MAKYSVLLMYPDYLAESYGETYLYQGDHESALKAREAAQTAARQANYTDAEAVEAGVSDLDFSVLLVVKGGEVV
jgi:hypothetical protein